MKISVNPDKEIVNRIRTALKENEGYCPCALQRTPETKCMCKNFLEEIEEGYCHCGLYMKTKD